VLGNFTILAHRVGHASAGVHAGERGADQGEEDGEGFHQHEDASAASAEERVADENHHVTNGSRRTSRTLHGVPTTEEVVCREILKEVAECALHQKRGNNRDWY